MKAGGGAVHAQSVGWLAWRLTAAYIKQWANARKTKNEN